MKKGQELPDGNSDLLQNRRVGISCCADHFNTVRFLILLTVFELLSENLQFYHMFYF